MTEDQPIPPELILRLRKYHELNQANFAVRCGLEKTSASSVSSWEKGQTQPSGIARQRLLRMLKTAGM